MNNVHAIPMTLALILALGFFAKVMAGKMGLLLAAQHRKRFFTDIPQRFQNMLVYALGQRKLFKELLPGLMHAFIFWGFLVLQIRTLYLIIIAFDPHFHLPLIHDNYTLLKDLTEALVLAMCCAAAWRRVFTQPERLTFSIEALVVLGMIGGLMLTDFLYDGFLFAHATTAAAAAGSELALTHPGLVSEMAHAPIGSMVAGLLMGSDIETLTAGREIFYWSHIFIVLTFLNLLPGSKHFHVITSLPSVFFSETTPVGALEPIEDMENQESFGVGNVTGFNWGQLLDLYSCTECGRCQVNCPTTITGKPLNPKLLITSIRNNLYENEADILKGEDPESGASLIAAVAKEAIWDCTTCRACSEACPVQITHVDKIVDMRRHLVLMEADFPKELGLTLRNLEQKGNPWGLPRSDRAAWSEGLHVPTLIENPDAEYVFWVGCAGAYDDRQKKVSRALVMLLKHAGISFATMGEAEGCTGDPARRAGNEYLFAMQAEENVANMRALGVHKKKLVTHCPHCFNTIKNEYPQFGLTFEVVHHSTLIATLVADGRLEPKKTPAKTKNITFHDSCYIGRYNEVYEEPRAALAAIPGVTLREMARNRTTGMCCGAGGARVWMEEHRGARINQTRVDQALEVSPDTIAVACPFCNMMLQDGCNEKGIENVQTRDVAELILESLEQD